MATKTNYLGMRINGTLKDKFWDFCLQSGLSISAAVCMFAKKSVAEGTLPIEIITPENDELLKKMEREGGIADKRVSIRMDADLRSQFSDICEEVGISMSTALKIFMVQCVDKGKMPFLNVQRGKTNVQFLN